MPRDSDVETSVERADPLVGTIFDRRFKIEERIATGGFGAIYRATHVKSGHPVALKVLLPSLAQDLGIVARFRREGTTLTALRNPHTISAYELGQAADHTLFITMELLHGESLFERYKANGPLEWKRVVRIARQICESLEEAHAMGIVHRDLKPTNIHLETKGGDSDFVKVLDFGIAKIIGGELDASDLTNAGQMVGTLDYMSPEQMLGGAVTGQTDIYTLGIVMYEMIAGTTPFPEAMTAAQALAAMMKGAPDPLYLRVPVPEELDRIVQKCLARETERRYQAVADLRADLDRMLAGGAADRAGGLDTKPIARQDDEATMFTPPPQVLVAASRRAKRPSGEETTFTPPPEPLLAASRGAADWSNEATTAASPSAQLLAASRRAKRPSVEDTTFTPPPEKVLADLRAPKSPRAGDDEWTDEDEHAATVRRRREPSDTAPQGGDHDKVTAVARLADIVERAAMTRGPSGSPRALSERAVTVPRDASERAATIPRDASERTVPVSRVGAQARDTSERTAGSRGAGARAVTAAASRKPPSAPPHHDARSRTGTAQPPSALTPPRTTTPPRGMPAMASGYEAHRSPHGGPASASGHAAQGGSTHGGPTMPRTPTPHDIGAPAMPRTISPHGPAMPRTPTPHDVGAPAMPRTMSPHDIGTPAIPRTMSPHGASTHGGPSMPRTMTPHDLGGPSLPRVPTPQQMAVPTMPSQPGGPVPPLAAAPFSSPSYPGAPYASPGSQGASQPGMSPYPPSPYPSSYPVQSSPQAGHGFDMGKMAAREATIRRLIWIVVLVLAVAVGVVLAARFS